jgi:hypothetical protein
MQAWTYNITDSSSSSADNMDLDVLGSIQINSFSLNSASFQDMHVEIWARLTQVKAIVNSSPSALTDGKFITVQIQLPSSVLFEMVHEFVSLSNGRKVARMDVTHDPLRIFDTTTEDHVDNNVSVGQKRKKTLLEAPVNTLQVRRSPRCNKYAGFKPRNDSDTTTVKSKVKPRKQSNYKESSN